MSFVKDFTGLETYKLARSISFEIFQLTKMFPPEEKYSLTDQIRRASHSVGAQIAESWGKRRYEKHFISKQTDADAEIPETRHWLATAEECEYISQEVFNTLNSQCELSSKKINSMILKEISFVTLINRNIQKTTIYHLQLTIHNHIKDK